MKTVKVEKIEIQRRVVSAKNGIQYYMEELVEENKIKVWKIAKVFYSHMKATRYVEGLN